MSEMKYCNDPNCEQNNPQPLSNFYSQNKYSKKRGNWIYYNPECKECRKKRSYEWRDKNPEKHKESMRKSNQREEIKLINRERSIKRRLSGAHKEWQQNNPDKVRKNNQYRSLHKKHKISKKEWLACKQYFNNSCAYCGIHIDDHYITYAGKLKKTDFAKEHVDDNGANDLSNCIPSCRDCNSHKWKFDMLEWYSKQEFFSEDRLDKISKWTEEDYKLHLGKSNQTNKMIKYI